MDDITQARHRSAGSVPRPAAGGFRSPPVAQPHASADLRARTIRGTRNVRSSYVYVTMCHLQAGCVGRHGQVCVFVVTLAVLGLETAQLRLRVTGDG